MNGTQFKATLLLDAVVLYVVVGLLFLTSVTLHIHTSESAMSQPHGSAVSISAIADDLSQDNYYGEIVVSPESVIKKEKNHNFFFAVFLFIAVVLVLLRQIYFGRRGENQYRLSIIPYFGVPLLRAPPL